MAGTATQIVGGMPDHIHILIGLKPVHRLSDVVRDIKSSSSEWVHREIGLKMFSWQDGYGAFTVSSSQRGAVRNYISNQTEHHRKKTFQEEYLELLAKSEIEYDERYLW